jgi:hypothetical protein
LAILAANYGKKTAALIPLSAAYAADYNYWIIPK